MSNKDKNNNLEEENNNSEIQEQSNIDTALVYEWDTDRDIWDEMETCYLNYAMSVIVNRALPDVRDWLKPVHRRILYAMHNSWMKSSSKYKKSARVVWDVIWKYHPHWDTAVYEAMVRLAQDFSLRYPLIDGHWNFWSMDWDWAAAMRYTEARMSKLSDFMLSDIDKETVDWRDNYDWSCLEPKVLPARVPNLIINWVMWIAVWMATNIPPHNLWEIIEALLFILDHGNPEDILIKDLMQFIKWPDFPTWAIIYNSDAIAEAYATWRWSIIIRWKTHIEELKWWKNAIIIDEVPYQVNKANLQIKLADLVRDKIIVWITDIRDESNKDSVRVVIELRRDAFPKKVLNQIYKLTQLQTSFWFNMIALTDRWLQPKLFNLLEILREFLDHRNEVVTRRTKYELKIAEARAHILEWLKIALDNIDAVIKTIKESKNKEEASISLMSNFKLTEIQAKAILEMQLQKLSGLERQKLEDELKIKLGIIADLKDILSNPERIKKIIIEELEEVKNKFNNPRLTEIHSAPLWSFNAKDTIPDEEVIVSLSKNNYIKRIKASSFRTQNRWWKWVVTSTKDKDEVKEIIYTKNHNDLLFFTNTWRVFALPVYEIPEMARTAKWQPIINLLNLQKDEEITTILDLSRFSWKNLFFTTKKWTIKRVDIKQFSNIRQNWLIAIKINKWDELGWVKVTNWEDNIFLITSAWKAIQFKEDQVRVMSRTAKWVKWIRLKWEDKVVKAVVVRESDEFLFTATANWLWKITSIEEYKSQKRWWTWVNAGKITKKTGPIIWAAMLSADEKKNTEIMLISKWWQTIRLNLKWMRTTSRVTQWIILTKLKKEWDTIISMEVMKSTEVNNNDKNNK